MAITYSWIVDRFGVTPDTGNEHDVIRYVEWRMSGTDGVHSVIGLRGGDNYPYGYGTTNFPPPEPDNFRPFDEFTLAELSAFLDENVPQDDQVKIQQDIAQQLATLTNPELVEKFPPWSTV